MAKRYRSGASGVFMALLGIVSILLVFTILVGIATSSPDLVRGLLGTGNDTNADWDGSDTSYYDSYDPYATYGEEDGYWPEGEGPAPVG